MWATAVAASLMAAVGFLAGQQWQAEPPLEQQLPRAATINAALESLNSSAYAWQNLEAGFQLRPVLSFADKSGTYCREYELSSNEQGWRGVACREQGQWQTKVLVNLETGGIGTGQYRAAAADNSALITFFIDQHIDGIPLGPEEESARINDEWR
jgi:hypothetical protein